MTPNQLEDIEFENNPEPRCALALLIDTSLSMKGSPIDEVNVGLQELAKSLKDDRLASLRVEISLVTFGGTVNATEFITADQFQPQVLEATGNNTPLGEAVSQALVLLRERKDSYKKNSVDYFRPWLFMITDGAPTDDWEPAAEQARQEEERKGVSVYAIGVENADMKILAQFSSRRQPLKLNGLAFKELFKWLSTSLSSIAQSRPGEQTALPSVGWGQADTTV